MGGNNTKPEEFKFGSYQYGTRPGYHVTSDKVFYTGRILKGVDPNNFTAKNLPLNSIFFVVFLSE